ncbi:MAG TPA: hypothetical protein VK471_01440 [Solirubrobacterales bacterium]|nr:hypothetical protein [Solirubrobacterales bacterium]
MRLRFENTAEELDAVERTQGFVAYHGKRPRSARQVLPVRSISMCR